MRSILITCLLLYFCPTQALQGQEPDQSLGAFGEVIDVRVLNLEVAVTDKNGQSVSGLQAEDFRLFVDGESVPIEYFSEIRQGVAKSSTPGAIAAAPQVTPGEVAGTSFLLFVDNFFGHARDRKVVLQEIIDGLPEMGPKDRMAVVAFNGRQLDLVGDWSGSPGAIANTLRTAMEQPAFGLQRRGELGQYEAQLATLNSGLIEESSRNILVQYVTKLSRQVGTVVKAATTAMRTMASTPGRKVLLLTSGGWPDEPVTYATGNPSNAQILDRSLYTSPKNALRDLADTANLLGYTIYPIDLAGKQSGGPTAAEGGDRAVGAAAGAFDPATSAFGRTGGRENEVELPLLVLAEKTGGLAMLNGLRQAAIQETLQDTGNYYWLGYAPTWERNDEQHEVRVETVRKDLKSRSRQGFKDLSRQTEVTMLVESNLLFSTPLGDHSLDVTLGNPKRAGRRKIELPISFKVPLDNIVMLPVARGFEAKLELRVAVMGEDGDRSEIPIIPVNIGGKTRPAAGAYAVYETSLKLRKAKQRLALALYDVAGEQFLSTLVEFDPTSL